MIRSSAGQAPPVVVPMPLVGQAIIEAKEAPLEVAAQPAMEVMPLPMPGRAELRSHSLCQPRQVRCSQTRSHR